MDEWAITDPKIERVYGTVLAANEVDAVKRIDLGMATWFWRSEPGPHEKLAPHPVETLNDGKWRELGVTVPGGAVLPEQVGESLSRSFGRAWADGTWSIFTATWFVADYGDAYTDERRHAVRLERQEEFLMCADVHQWHETATFEDRRYLVEQAWAAEPASVPYAAADFDPDAEIMWSGEEY